MPDKITQDMPNLIKKFGLVLIMCLSAVACTDDARSRLDGLAKARIVLPSGKEVKVFVAQTPSEQTQGLSDLRPEQFQDDESMLFPAKRNQVRQFWMPNTHFNLDIVFLNKDLYVLDVHKDLRHYPKEGPKDRVPLSKAVYSRHVLELKSSSPLAKEIQPGMSLKWIGDDRLLQRE